MGEIQNNYMSFDNLGVPPSLNKLMGSSKSEDLKKDKQSGYAKSDNVSEKDKNTFKHFGCFMAKNEVFLIPLDNENFKKSVINEDLVHHIMHGR